MGKMKYKKIMLATLMLLAFLAIGAVSASADELGNDISAQVNETCDDSNIIKDVENEYDYNSSSFKALNDKFNQDNINEIELDHDYTFNEENDADFTQGIVISKSITVNGNGKTIDAKSKARIFTINEGNNVVLKNINFINGFSDGDGGVINIVNSNLTVIDSLFKNSTAKTGGAIYAYESNLELKNNKFLENNADEAGGSIILRKTNVNIFKNTFTDSHAGGGGALQILANGINGVATFENCIFKNCTSLYAAGFFYSSLKTIVKNCSFENIADGDYGGVVVDANIEIYDSSFKNSHALKGGALSLNSDKISKIINCAFEDNLALEGGAIYSTHNLTITNTYFKNNTAQYRGGAIYDAKNKFNITDNVFTDNKALIEGGALYFEGGVQKSHNYKWASYEGFTYSLPYVYVTSSYTSSAAKKYVTYQNLVNAGIFNYANDARIQIVIDYYQKGNTGHKSFYKDFPTSGGSLIYKADILIPVGEGIVKKNIFMNNNATQNGGAIYSNANNLVIEENKFINNSASEGSAIYISNKTQIRTGVVDAKAVNGYYYFPRTELYLGEFTFLLYEHEWRDPRIETYIEGDIETVVGNNVKIFNNIFTQNYADSMGNLIIDEGSGNIIENNTDNNSLCSSTIFSITKNVLIHDNIFDDSRLKTIISIETNNTHPIINENLKLTITLKDEKNCALPNQIIKLTIDNVTSTLITDKYGKAIYIYTPYAVEEKTLSIEYDENQVFINSNSPFGIKAKIKTIITVDSVTANYNEDKFLIATLTDSNNNALADMRLSVLLDGVSYVYSTDAKGQVKLSIKGLNSNSYNVKIFFEGGYDYTNSSATSKITINPLKSNIKVKNKVKLTLKKVKVKRSAKKLILTATLKINGKAAKSKKVTFKFNGKKYTSKTNKKGVAKVTIKKKVLKKLKVGKKVKYQASYGKIIAKKTAKIKK